MDNISFKKIKTGMVITGNEKFILEFTLGKKRTGIEKVYVQKNKNFFEKTSVKETSIDESLYTDENLMKLEYLVFDDFEKGNINRVGTTLVNFLNQADKIREYLFMYLKKVENLSIKEIENLCNKIKKIIDDYKVNSNEIDKELSYTFYEIWANARLNEIFECCEQLEKHIDAKNNKGEHIIEEELRAIKFTKKIFSLKFENYYDESTIFLITDSIFQNEEIIDNSTLKNIVEDIYNHNLKVLIQDLERKIKDFLNEPLQILIDIIFKQFYGDFYTINNKKEKLYDYFVRSAKNSERYPYNLYYKNMFEYMDKIRKKKGPNIIEKFKNFSFKEMSIIFIKSLISNIDEMITENNKELPLFSSNIIINNKTHQSEISSLYEMFYISKYYISQDGRELKKCHLCGKYFVTENTTAETHCRRIFKNGKNCSEYANLNSRTGNDISKKIGKIYNNITSMLRNRDKYNHTTELANFNKRYNDIKLQGEETQQLLSWLKEEHKKLKSEYKKN